MEKINKVLLVAGTHGNELSGIYLQELIKNKLYQPDRTTFTTESIRSNSKAVEECRRFISHDLNRQFSSQTEVVNEESNEHAIAEALRSKHGENDSNFVLICTTPPATWAQLLSYWNQPLFIPLWGLYKKENPRCQYPV
ncbi:probable aspartoacylase [Vibrio astriarenae]|nr:probable aspartoacylase [Vibrio sp. C7]